MDYSEKALEMHRKMKGKIEVISRIKIESMEDLAVAYTPGVAAVSRIIAEDRSKSYEYTSRSRTIAVVTDGSAVLGLGNIGPEAAMPVMEGKAVLFKELGGVDAVPICLDTQDVDEIVKAVRLLSPSFGGINLEDIAAPRCFEVVEKLRGLEIPVFHDDQDGTAIVVRAALINACKVLGRDMGDLTVVINGAGAAGIAVARLLSRSVGEIRMLDSRGLIYEGREGLNKYKQEMATVTNKRLLKGGLKESLRGSDVFIGVSRGNLLSGEMVRLMNREPMIFAMANPDPEILPDEALRAGAAIVGTGRSDFPNQINNVLAFPGIFKGLLRSRAQEVTDEMKLAASEAIAGKVANPERGNILPSPLDRTVADAVAEAVCAEKSSNNIR